MNSALDPLAILAALGVTGEAQATPVYGGFDTAIWRVERAGAVYALRVFQEWQARACRNEVAALQVAAAGGVPVPAIHAQGEWLGRPALLLSWLPGQTLLRAFGQSPWRIWALATDFGRTQARIHSVSAPASLRQRDWIALAGPEEGQLQEKLRRQPLQPDALLHLDYHPLNVMVDRGRVSGVLDWPKAMAGDRRADLARTAALFRLTTLLPDIPPSTRILLPIVQLAWQRGYQQVAGRVTGMAPFYAWAGAMTIRDMTEERERPGPPMPPGFLDPLRRWTEAWKQRAGVI
jgi:aminoglycoside phosphotransferase (APT) family kinase protein